MSTILFNQKVRVLAISVLAAGSILTAEHHMIARSLLNERGNSICFLTDAMTLASSLLEYEDRLDEDQFECCQELLNHGRYYH